jgi:hypothetical protein
MHQEFEARSPKHRQPKKELHHIEIHAHPDGTAQVPAWVVLHHFGPEHDEDLHAFDNHEAMLDHVRMHTAAGSTGGEEEENV